MKVILFSHHVVETLGAVNRLTDRYNRKNFRDNLNRTLHARQFRTDGRKEYHQLRKVTFENCLKWFIVTILSFTIKL